MRKVATTVLALAAATSMLFAQSAKDIRKEREETKKMTKAELNAKSSKAARNEAKSLKKEGWVVAPGALPLEKQLDRAYLMEYERDDDGFPKYITGDAMSIGENYDAALMQANELAKMNVAGKIQTEITALIENSVSNKQLKKEEAASVTQSIMASKNLISQSLGRTIPLVEAYRILSNKNPQVRVRIAYNAEMAREAAKKVIRQDLEEKGIKLQGQLDKLLGL